MEGFGPLGPHRLDNLVDVAINGLASLVRNLVSPLFCVWNGFGLKKLFNRGLRKKSLHLRNSRGHGGMAIVQGIPEPISTKVEMVSRVDKVATGASIINTDLPCGIKLLPKGNVLEVTWGVRRSR